MVVAYTGASVLCRAEVHIDPDPNVARTYVSASPKMVVTWMRLGCLVQGYLDHKKHPPP